MDWDENLKKRRRYNRSRVHVRGYGLLYLTSGFGWAPSGWTSQTPPTDQTPNEVPGEGMQGGVPLQEGQFQGIEGGDGAG